MMAVCEKIQCVWGRFAKLLVDGDSFSRRTEKQKKNTVRARSFVDCGIGEYGRSRANKNKKGKKKKKKGLANNSMSGGTLSLSLGFHSADRKEGAGLLCG